MKLYEDDLGLGHETGADSMLLDAPSSRGIGISPEQSSGLGLGAEQAPAPVADMQARPVMSRATQQMDSRKALIAEMGTGEKILSALGEFGAGVQGKASPLDARIKAQREERALQTQELRANVGLLRESVNDVMKLDGDQRNKAISALVPQLDQVNPGMGKVLEAFKDDPKKLGYLLENFGQFPEIQMALKMDGSGRTAMKLAQSSEFILKVTARQEERQLSTLLKVGQTIKENWPQFVSPGVAAKLSKQSQDGRITYPDFVRIVNDIKENNPVMAQKLSLSDENVALIHKQQETYSHSLGIVSGKDDADVRKKKAEGENKADKESPLAVLQRERDALPKGSAARREYDKRIAKETEHAPGVTVQNMPSSSGMGVNPATGKQAHFTIGKDGTVRWDSVEPLPKDVDPVKKAIADAINKPGDKSKPAAAPKSGDAPALPPAIAAALKPGINSKLSDGTTWTLGADGKPKKVK